MSYLVSELKKAKRLLAEDRKELARMEKNRKASDFVVADFVRLIKSAKTVDAAGLLRRELADIKDEMRCEREDITDMKHGVREDERRIRDIKEDMK